MAMKAKLTERDKRRRQTRLVLGLSVVGMVAVAAVFVGHPFAGTAVAIAGVRGVVIMLRGWPNRQHIL